MMGRVNPFRRMILRKMTIRACFAWLAAMCWVLPGEAAPPVDSFEKTLAPFLASYCIDCHDDGEANGGRSFASLSPRPSSRPEIAVYKKIYDQLAAGAMPPADSDQPSAAERAGILEQLASTLDKSMALLLRTERRPGLRRLNAREYRHTVRDLLALNMTLFDPTREFPRDQTVEHLDTIGETLVTSGFLLEKQLDAAEQVIDRALRPYEKPPVQRWTFRDGFRQQPEIDQVHRRTSKFEYLILYEVPGADKHEGAYAPILAFRQGVPENGYYEIRFRAEAVHRRHPYDPDFLGMDPNEPLRLAIVPGNAKVGALHKPQPVEPPLAEFTLADEPRWYTARVWLDRGYTPRFTFPNGLMDVRNLWSRLIRKYPDQFPKRKTGGIVEARYNAIAYGKLPQIHIHEVEIRGPLYDSWPRASQAALLGKDASAILESRRMSPKTARRLLGQFLRRAYRRPVSEEEIERFVELMQRHTENGSDDLSAFGLACEAALVSPSFLYLEGATGTDPSARLSPHALASRLSYFVWSSMPDEELFQLADRGVASQPKVLEQQVDRCLQDPRAAALIDGLLDSWLTLSDLGSMPPDRNRFSNYYRYQLREAMRRETFLFLAEMLRENRPLTDLLDADYTYVNRPLAKLYGIEPPAERGFQRVTLRDERRRGLLGHASILTVTANGIDTSPVIRGVWLLSHLLGSPPPPPPENVKALDPDVRGTKTIREQLARHRDSESCNSCHRQIDPLGFALENFDPIGRWRDRYSARLPVDASGELPGGRHFENVVGLRAALLERAVLVETGLARKLIAYGTGRAPNLADAIEADRLIRELHRRNGGLRDLVRLVVLSDAFQR